MDEIEHTCESCVHEHDSGTEFCGPCDGMMIDCWEESADHQYYRLADKQQVINAKRKEGLNNLISVLCNPEGLVCVEGTDEDRNIIQQALKELEYETL